MYAKTTPVTAEMVPYQYIFRKITVFVILSALLAVVPSCGEKEKPNRVDLEQFEADRSNDYRYIFRDVIEEDARKRSRFKRKEFQ